MKGTGPQRIGIGIVTYNRRDVLAATVDAVRRMTRHPLVDFVVADDGSTDGTLGWLRDNDVPTVTGPNMGIAWNKNRALYLLSEMLGCEATILLEDDTQPNKAGWEQVWIEAARLWGHVNYAAPWMTHLFLSGQGTIADPVLSAHTSAQCTVYSRDALRFGGYYDSRFRGYGHEHVEHTIRLARAGYGEAFEIVDSVPQSRHRLIAGDLSVVNVPSYLDVEQADRNEKLAWTLLGEDNYRAPWQNETEMRQFRSEIRSAIDSRLNGFALHPTVKPGPLGRWFAGRRS